MTNDKNVQSLSQKKVSGNSVVYGKCQNFKTVYLKEKIIIFLRESMQVCRYELKITSVL